MYLFKSRLTGYPGNYTQLFGLRMEEVGKLIFKKFNSF